MNEESLRNFLVVVSILVAFFGMMISFARIKQQPQYKNLIASGQRLNLNLNTMIPAFFRKSDDPLREANVQIARIGLLHLAAMILGFVLLPILIVGILWLAGIR